MLFRSFDLTSLSEELLLAPVGIFSRKDQASLPIEERTAFKNAILHLVSEGKYFDLIRFHMNMRYNMHGTMGLTGLYRFLAWHRRYLVEFERNLQRADLILRPSATEAISVPYWRWEDGFPDWLDGFLPVKNLSNGSDVPPRKTAPPPEKATASDIDIIVNGFRGQVTNIPGENDYTKFTYGLEGWGSRPDGSSLPAHNHGHAWVGGIMNNTSMSPTDPIFWLHHAQVDRLWYIWQQNNPSVGPPLTGQNRIMQPWAESYDALLDITGLGYTYDSLAI